MSSKLTFLLVGIVAIGLTSSFIVGAAQRATPEATTPELQPATDPHDHAAHAHAAEPEAPVHEHLAVGLESDPPMRRFVHTRIFAEDGSLLQSSWADEVGSLESLDPGEDQGPYAWGRAEELRDPNPLWAPLLDFLFLGPVESTVRLDAFRTPADLRLGQVTVPKEIELRQEATISRADADATIRKNVSEGTQLWFMGQLPMRILHADAESVTYRFDVAPGEEFDVARSIGLKLAAIEPTEPGTVRLAVVIPEDGFLAHNNCQVERKALLPGYYRLHEQNETDLVLDRYETHMAYALEDRIIDLEITYRDITGSTEMAELKAARALVPDPHAH